MSEVNKDWQVIDEHPERACLSVSEFSEGYRKEVCTVYLYGDKDELAERERRAHLIAAAPELLEALSAAMKFIEANVADPDITEEMAKAWMKLEVADPYAALAKAKGDTQ